MASQPLNDGAAERRLHMVNGQLRTSDVRDSRVLTAFLSTPRERFVAESMANVAYLDQDIPASGPSGRKLLAPRTLALLLQAAAVEPGERVLDVGGGSGFGAAILAHMGAKVVALESSAATARSTLQEFEGVETVEGELVRGSAERGPFDVIVVEGAIEVAPTELLSQLAEGGRLVAVDARGAAIRGIIFDKSIFGIGERLLFDARAEVLPSFERRAEFAF